MSFNDSLSDMLTRIRNAHRVNKSITYCFSSNLNNNVLKVLKDEGYIRSYNTVDIREGINTRAKWTPNPAIIFNKFILPMVRK